ncbi:MAG TPA: portal protein, partial [Cellvibrio sp.]
YRAVQERSEASDLYSTALKRVMIGGYHAAMVDQDYIDDDSFDQDLFLRDIPDAVNRVWFFGNWEKPTAEDADAVTVDYTVTEEEFKEICKEERKPESLSCDSEDWNHWAQKREGHLISRLFYKKEIEKTIYQLPDGTVVSEEDHAELMAGGLPMEGMLSRKRKAFKVYVRYYDNKGWLNDAEETVFEYLPVVPCMPNFNIVNNMPICYGKFQDLLDPQRAHNFLASRIMYDTALAPKPKIWVGKKAVESQNAQAKLKNYNNNSDPVFVHDGIDNPYDAPNAVETTGLSPALSVAVQLTRMGLDDASGQMGASDGLTMANQSGEAISLLQKKGDVVDLEYAKALVRFAKQLAKVSMRAMQKLYTGRKTINNESGEPEEVRLDREVMTPKGIVAINDLTIGSYDVVSDVVPKTESMRREAAEAIERVGAVMPEILINNRDIFLASLDAPGMDKLASRERRRMLDQGLIPEDEMTEQEKQVAMQKAQQPQQPDPMQVLALATAEAEVKKADAQTAKAQSEAQVAVIKASQAQQKMDFEQEVQSIKLLEERQDKMLEAQMKTVEMLNKMADTLNKLREASGADAIVSPAAAEAYSETAQGMADMQ